MWSIGRLLGSLMLLGGCSGTGGGTDACGPWRPVLVSRADVLSDGTARQVLAHNETGRQLCGW
jgi:hypothetical protein